MSALAAASDIEVRVRAEVYSFLSTSVQYPRESVSLGLLEHIRFDDESLESARADVVNASTSDVPLLQAAHRVLFPAVESQDAPSYETAYSLRDVFRQAQVMADVAGFYRSQGLTVGGTIKDRPDGIGPELEFMGFLAAKQAQARATGHSDNEEICLDTQKLFLRDHLGGWGPDYGKRLTAVSEHAFYKALGLLLTGWIDTELAILGVEPQALEDIDDGVYLDAVPLADPHVNWDDLSCGGVV